MQAPMQPSSSQRGLQVPTSTGFGARRSISHDLARFSLDLAPDRRPSNKVPYPSPPMSHSPPPLNPQPPNEPRPQATTTYYNSHGGHMQPSYGYSQRYPQEQQQQQQQTQQQPTPFSTNGPSPGEPESFPAPFPSISNNNNEHYPASDISPPGRSPFVPQTSFPPPPPPRRPKSHVASACVNCKKAHLACDTRRPCPRCVGLGKQDTCVDVQHKKRGRPRLRDDSRSHSFEISQMQRPGIYSSPSSPSAMAPSSRGGPHRVLKSQPVDAGSRGYRRQSLQDELLVRGQSHYSDHHHHHQRSSLRPSKISLPPITNAQAYLTTDLVVAKSTHDMRELLGYNNMGDLDGRKSLFDIVLDADRERVERLVMKIHEEIRQRDPNWNHWNTASAGTIQGISESQVQMLGVNAYNETLHLRRPEGTFIKIRIRASLATTTATSLFFVVMAFTLANEMPPPLQLNHSTSYSSLRTPTPGTAPLHSPSFLTSGPQSPYSHPPVNMAMTSPMESARPRTMGHPPPPPPPQPLSQYTNPSPSPATSTFYRRPSDSPATATMTPTTFCAPQQQQQQPQQGGLLQQSDLQLPPLKLSSLPDYGRHRISVAAAAPTEVEMPRRERIGVREMLE